MVIYDSDVKFVGNLEKRKSTKYIILHHAAATKCGVEDIHKWHLSNGWAGIGYHFLVRKDGSIYRGRPEDTIGAHAYGANSVSIGICFEGNFEKESMSFSQLNSGIALVKYLKKKYDGVVVKKHSDFNATACPGKNFPFDSFQSDENRVLSFQQALIKDGYTFPKYGADGMWGSECESAAKKCLVMKRTYYTNLNATALVQGWLGIPVDGFCGPQTSSAIKEFQSKHGLTSDGIVGLNTWKALIGV